MMRPSRPWFAVPILLAVTMAVACGQGTEVNPEPDPEPGANAEPGVVSTPPLEAAQVAVTLSEFSVAPEVDTAAAGPVYFLAYNAGAEPHEFVVIETDLPPGDLPVVDGRVPEDDVEMIGEIEPFASGTNASIVLDLEPGAYALICNIVEEEASGKLESHYEEGMYAGFTVE